ncbi:hypothetical protein SESBI_11252 [Sesbania bispinosa]|nr:hypothetical protein SESBI_11252 [Sesbania bispinosa]
MNFRDRNSDGTRLTLDVLTELNEIKLAETLMAPDRFWTFWIRVKRIEQKLEVMRSENEDLMDQSELSRTCSGHMGSLGDAMGIGTQNEDQMGSLPQTEDVLCT